MKRAIFLLALSCGVVSLAENHAAPAKADPSTLDRLAADLATAERNVRALLDAKSDDERRRARAALETLGLGAAPALLKAREDATDKAKTALLDEALKGIEVDKGIAGLLVDLDDDAFFKRERASRFLESLGQRAVPALKKHLETKPSLEVTRRIEIVLERIGPDVRAALPRIRQLLVEMDDDKFITREKAMKELVGMDPKVAGPALRAAHDSRDTSLEVRYRIRRIFSEWGQPLE